MDNKEMSDTIGYVNNIPIWVSVYMRVEVSQPKSVEGRMQHTNGEGHRAK